jgi:hypothetical protein
VAASAVTAAAIATADANSDADRRTGRRFVVIARRRAANDHDVLFNVAYTAWRRLTLDALRRRIGIDALPGRGIDLLLRRR